MEIVINILSKAPEWNDDLFPPRKASLVSNLIKISCLMQGSLGRPPMSSLPVFSSLPSPKSQVYKFNSIESPQLVKVSLHISIRECAAENFSLAFASTKHHYLFFGRSENSTWDWNKNVLIKNLANFSKSCVILLEKIFPFNFLKGMSELQSEGCNP